MFPTLVGLVYLPHIRPTFFKRPKLIYRLFSVQREYFVNSTQ
jgi:hypothetical protein